MAAQFAEDYRRRFGFIMEKQLLVEVRPSALGFCEGTLREARSNIPCTASGTVCTVWRT